jgi:hypothetical protein
MRSLLFTEPADFLIGFPISDEMDRNTRQIAKTGYSNDIIR